MLREVAVVACQKPSALSWTSSSSRDGGGVAAGVKLSSTIGCLLPVPALVPQTRGGAQRASE